MTSYEGPNIFVLLVEDNPGDVRMAREAFRSTKLPLSLHVAGDGTEAMDFLHRSGVHSDAPRPHLILLDLNLPSMDGREVLKRIKADDHLRAIPTIVLTSSEDVDDIHFCNAHSANCFLRKPAHWDEFERLLTAINDLWLPGLLRCTEFDPYKTVPSYQ